MTTFAPRIKQVTRYGWVNANMIVPDPLPEPNWPEQPYWFGWSGELTYPNRTNFDDHFQQYRDMVEWIKENIKNPEQNVFWNKIGDCIYVRFRNQKDKNWFAMRFGI